MVAQQFKGMQQLRALADNITDVLACRELIHHCNAKRLDGGHMANVWYLCWQTFSLLALAVGEDEFSRLSLVKSQIVVLFPILYTCHQHT